LERPRVEAGDGPATAVTGRKRRIIIPIAVVLVLVGLFYGIRYLIYSSHHVSTDDAQINGNITTVGARVKGQIVAVYAKENQFVRKGQALAQIDPRDFQVAVDQAQAAYQQALNSQVAAQLGVPQQAAITQAQSGGAQAQISQAEARQAQAQAQVAAAEDQLKAAQAQLVKSLQDLTRAQQLESQGAIPKSQLDAAQAQYAGALAARDAARQNVAAAQDAVAQAAAEVRASGAQLQQAETGVQTTQIKSSQAATSAAQTKAAYAALQAAKLQLSYTTFKAPVDGIVSKKSVSVGDTVAVGQPLMAIADQARLWVTANLKETQLTHIRPGQPVAIHVDAFPKQTFSGKVESLAPATGATFALIPPDNATGNFTKVVQRVPVRIAIDASSDPQQLLRQGLSAEVTIDISSS
jgi:membrane fusion protein (multidrug efflux system)